MACKRLGLAHLTFKKHLGLTHPIFKKKTRVKTHPTSQKTFLMASEMCCFDLIDLNQCVLII